MAKTDTAKVEAEKDPYELVEILIGKAECNSEEGHFIGINGKTYLIPKNKPSMVPRYVAEEIQRCRKAQAAADAHIDELAFKIPTNIR